MRKIVNKKVDNIEYMEIYRNALSTPESGDGTDYEEMMRVLPILEKLNHVKVDEHVLLEEAEYKELSKRVKAMKFTMNDKALLALVEHVINAEEVPVTEK